MGHHDGVSSNPDPPGRDLPDALIVAGGDAVDASELTPPLERLGWSVTGLDRVPLIAADSGADLALDLGLVPDVVIGDMDSISPLSLTALDEKGVPLIRHPRDKDRTDLELALDETASRLGVASRAVTPTTVAGTASAHTVLVLGAGGGRLDHLLGNLAVLGAARYHRLGPVIVTPDAIVIPVGPGTGTRPLPARPGDTVTLLALGGPAEGVTTSGLRYPLLHGELAADSSLGLSNVVGPAGPTQAPPSVSVARGTVLVIIPLSEGTRPPRSPREAR